MPDQTPLLKSIDPLQGLVGNTEIADAIGLNFERNGRSFFLCLYPGNTGKVTVTTQDQSVVLLTDFCQTFEDLNKTIEKLDDLISRMPPPEVKIHKIVKKNSDKEFAGQVVMIFNEITGRAITLTDTYVTAITGRVEDGKKMNPPIGLLQFQAVFKYKHAQWKDDIKMKDSIEIETLCRKSNFFRYLDQARDAHRKLKTTAK